MYYFKEIFLKHMTSDRSKIKGRKKVYQKYTTEKQTY